MKASSKQEAKAAPAANAASEDHAEASPVVELMAERCWRDLRATWQRGWPADDTPKALAIGKQAFFAALKDGADPDEVIAGARKWVGGIDAARYLPALPKWIAARGWEAAPPGKGKRHGRGSSRGGRPERRQRPCMTELGGDYGQWAEQHDAKSRRMFEDSKSRCGAERRAAP